ncbi:hypothetical protein J3R82DRAFT_2597 [Butyriboletus roseoflavus]|nr:hypothetical protein J3R82DRAFT_2597 [Butyriboletus roseoflavus]
MSIPSTFLSHVFTRKLFALVGNALLVYDYLITLSLEITYVWDAPWTAVKAIFLINRYGNLIGQTFVMLEETGYLSHNSQKFCVAYELYCSFFAIFSGESIRLLVIMRACAILGFKRSIAVLANTLYVICALTILAASLYLLRNAESNVVCFFSFQCMSNITATLNSPVDALVHTVGE